MMRAHQVPCIRDSAERSPLLEPARGLFDGCSRDRRDAPATAPKVTKSNSLRKLGFLDAGELKPLVRRLQVQHGTT